MWKSENCFLYFTLAFDCLFQISLNTNTFKQQQKKPVSPVISSLISPSSLRPEPIHRHLRFLPLRGDENCDWSAFPAGNERASLGGLFKQRLIRLQSCSRTAFHVTAELRCLLKPTWVIFPDQVLISEVFVACELLNVQRNMSVFFVCFEIIAVLSLHTQTVCAA